jgi:hypothetical protein
MRRAMFRFAVVSAFLLLVPVQALAQPLTGEEMDLAAMTLTPRDLDGVGLSGFGMSRGSHRDLETEVRIQTFEESADETASLRAKYEANDFRYRYISDLLRPVVPLQQQEDGDYDTDLRVSTGVTEYGTAEGAEAGFTLTEDESDDPNAQDVPDTRPFGEQSEMTRFSSFSSNLSTPPRYGLNLTFRLGNLVADVIVTDFTGTRPDPALIEQLGELLQARIEHVLADGAPGLSTRILRLDPIGGQINYGLTVDRYLGIGADNPPAFYEIIDAIAAGATLEEATGSPDTEGTPSAGQDEPAAYQVFAYITDDSWPEPPTDEGLSTLGYLYVNLYDEVTPDGAAGRFADIRSAFSETPDPSQFRIVPDATEFGDESFTGVLSQDGWIFYAIVARVGTEIAYVYVGALDQPTAVPAIEDLMTAQLECLETSGRCEPVAMPDALMVASGAPIIGPPEGSPVG